MWLSLLVSHLGASHGVDQPLSQQAAKSAAAEAEHKLIQAGLEMVFGQAVVGSQNKRFGVADHNMQPVEHTAVGVIGLMFVGVVLKCGNITAVTITADGAAGCNGAVGKFSHGGLLDILCHAHFKVLRIAVLVQRQSYENLCLFRTTAPFAARCWASKVGIIKLYNTRQQMRYVPLSHGGSNAPKHRPCGFIGYADLVGQLNGGEPSFVLGDEIESQKPLAQADMTMMQNCPGCDGGLMAAVGTLIQSVGQAAAMLMPAFRAYKAGRPALCGQIVPTAFLRSKPLQKLTQGHLLFL